MDVVIDLTTRAVAFITLAQDISYILKPQKSINIINPVVLLQTPQLIIAQLAEAKDVEQFQERIKELVGNNSKSSDSEALFTIWLNKMEAVQDWLNGKKDELIPKLCYCLRSPYQNQKEVDLTNSGIIRLDSYPAPQQWRLAIRQVLYESPQARVDLAKGLNYLPTLVVLGDKSTKGKKISKQLLKNLRKNWQEKEEILQMIRDDNQLFEGLKNNEVPFPFEVMYKQELKEINKSRGARKQQVVEEMNDPIGYAHDLKLRALAFSGGGIRSATFNLGILQGLAKSELLPKFDYLSTVSGGGYIGAWYSAWVKRDGLLLKVQDRLNPEKSADPRGEEVRPIRWLRMFSNYLAPNNNIMSSDSWTMGLTWFRNTLLNQLIILMLVCSVLLFGFCAFLYWTADAWPQNIPTEPAFKLFSFLLLGGALVAGLGMGAYRPDLFPRNRLGTPNEKYVTNILVALGLITSFWVSGWFFNYKGLNEPFTFKEQFCNLQGIVIIGFLVLVLVAMLGRYEVNLPVDKYLKKIGYVGLALFFTALSAILGVVFLTLAWWLIYYLANSPEPANSWEPIDKFIKENNKGIDWIAFFKTSEFLNRLAFIIGTPLLLEVLSLTVVVRMALLGKYFPDSRREWWARVGAMAHRFALGWVLLGSIGLLGGKILDLLLKQMPIYVSTIAGGWAALLIAAVRLAYSSITSGQEDNPKTMGLKAKDILVRTAPYLFMVGIFIIASKIIHMILQSFPLSPLMAWLQNRNLDFLGFLPSNQISQVAFAQPYHLFPLSLLTIIIIGLTIGLAWRVGVNEFSMHHFYRNRLMRGYLAATRRRTDRDKTANAFTGFDDMDDLKLCSLKSDKENGYQGPYPIINTTLNASQVTDLDRQDRQGESFVFTPLFCGFDISPISPCGNKKSKANEYGYRLTEQYAYEPKILTNGKHEPGGPNLSTAMAISGAAANPNMGTHSSSATAFLLTIFNARLGWWMGNPLGKDYKKSDPRSGLAYLIYDLLGRTSIDKDFVCLSDGGHFDNMGLYELIRRRVRVVILGDAEQDKYLTCEGLANAVRRCRVDFGVEIVIDIKHITNRDEKSGNSRCHYALGTIWYPEDPAGKPSGNLIYLKSSLNGQEPVDVKEYSASNPDFPHQSTADQFFNEPQFESYRRLGLHVIETALADPEIKSLLQT